MNIIESVNGVADEREAANDECVRASISYSIYYIFCIYILIIIIIITVCRLNIEEDSFTKFI